MNQLLSISNLGYTAYNNPMRAIRSGQDFEGVLPAPNWQEQIVKRNATVDQTVEEMKKLTLQSAWQTKELARRLLGKDIYTTCGNIWQFLFSHIRYKEDDKGKEQLRTPAVSWHIRRSRGIDCDDFSIFAGCILYNLKIPFYYRCARYEGKDYFQHVYVIIPQTTNNYITIDAVLDEYDSEKMPAETKDFLVMDKSSLNGIDVSVLSGTDEEAFNEISGVLNGVDFGALDELGDELGDDLEGINDLGEQEFLGAVYRHLVRTRNVVRKYPQAIRTVEDPNTFLGMLDYAIRYWDTDKRELALGILEEKEEELNRLNGLEGLPDEYEETTVFYGIEGLGGVSALGKAKKKKTFFKNVKNTVKTVKQKAKQVSQKTKQVVKKTAQKAKSASKKLKKGIIKNNPVSVAARAGMLLAMKTNFLKIAEKLKWGYLTESEARQSGFDMAEWGNAKTQLKKAEKLFVERLKGSPEKFKEAILKGRAGGLKGINENLGELGAAAAASAMSAAMPFIKQLLEFAKKINLKKLIQKVKASKLMQRNKKAETMPPADEEAETAMPEEKSDSESDSDTSNNSGSNSGSEASENSGSQENSNSGSSETGETDSGEKSNSEQSEGNSGSKSSSENSSENSGQEESGETSNLPATTQNRISTSSTDPNAGVLTKVTDWVKENPGKTALVVGGLILAFSSGARKAIGLGKVDKRIRKRKGNKKSNPPKAITGVGKKNKPKTKKRYKGKPKGGDSPKQIRL